MTQADKWLGTAYSWGGGGISGPSYGIGKGAAIIGFDCSGLAQYAVYHGTGVTIARTAQNQQTGDAGELLFEDLPPGARATAMPSTS